MSETATAPAPAARHRLVAASLEHIGPLMALFEHYAKERGQRVDTAALNAVGDVVMEAVRDPERHLIALAMVGKRPVGMIAASLAASPLAQIPRSLHVRLFYVMPVYRRRSRIAHALWTEVTGRARALGVPLTGQVAYDKATVRRWERKGYAPMAVVMAGGA